MLDLLNELFLFMREHKKFWLIPFIVVLGTFAALLFVAQGSAAAPFIYTLF
jgi:Family of unknown function (DUF5989)